MASTIQLWLRRIILAALLGSIVLSLLALWRASSVGGIRPKDMSNVDMLAKALLTGGLMGLLAGTVTAGIGFRWAGLLTFPAGVIAGYVFDMILPGTPGPAAIISFGIGMPGLFAITVLVTSFVHVPISALKSRFIKRPH